VHPHEAGRFAEEKERVRALLDEEKVIAVGEIGLDFHRDRAPRETQRIAFREQLGWARERGLPASVHNRAADEDVLSAIEESEAAAILHCFSGDWETASRALELGCVLSFAGNVTFRKAEALREVAARVPLDRLLVESDAPVLAPQPRRGHRNEPRYVVMTAEALAGARGLALGELADAVARNAETVLCWGRV
jgi:TatD DNase family protein